MATTLEELVFKFEADLSSLKAGLSSAQASVDKLEAGVKKSADKMGAALGGMGRLFKLDLIVRYGQQLILVEDRMEQLASQIRDTADRADIGVEALQRLRHAADQNGTSAEAMDSALIRLNKAMGLARSGAEGMDKIFAALGLGKLIEQGANTEQVFLGLTEAVSKMKDESQASAIMARVMGREADRLIELMKQGAPEVQRLGNELSRVISEDTINKLDTSRDKTEEFKKVVNSFASDASALAITLGHDLVSSLKDMFEWIEKNTSAMTALADAWNHSWNILAFKFGGAPAKVATASAPAASPFTRGGRGLLDPESPLRLPDFSGGGSSGITPDQGALNRLFGGGNSGGGGGGEAARAAERYRDVIADLSFELEQLGLSEQEAALQQQLRNALSSAGVRVESERGQAIAELVAQINAATQAQAEQAAAWAVEAANANRVLAEMHEQMREAAAEWESIGEGAKDGLADALVDIASGTRDAGEAMGEFVAQIGRAVAKMLILKAIEAGVDAVFGGGTVGGRATGGLVNAGNPYMVGESGPELFVPNMSGQIVPRGGAGGQAVVVNSVVHAGAGVSRAEFQMALDARDKALARSLPKMMIDRQRRGSLQGAFG